MFYFADSSEETSYSESESGSSSSDSSSGSHDTPQKRVRATDKALNERKLIKKRKCGVHLVLEYVALITLLVTPGSR